MPKSGRSISRASHITAGMDSALTRVIDKFQLDTKHAERYPALEQYQVADLIKVSYPNVIESAVQRIPALWSN